jgi:hypothetical protein
MTVTRRRGHWFRYDNEPNWVYSFWQGDECLYVGITNNLNRRIAAHRTSQPWWCLVDRIVSDEVLGRGAAMLFEEHDIIKYRPRFNVQYNPDRKASPSGGVPVENRGVRHG